MAGKISETYTFRMMLLESKALRMIIFQVVYLFNAQSYFINSN